MESDLATAKKTIAELNKVAKGFVAIENRLVLHGDPIRLKEGGKWLRHWSQANTERVVITTGRKSADTKWTVEKA